MKGHCLGLYRLHQFFDRFNVIGGVVFTSEGISAPQILGWTQNVIEPPSKLVEVCRLAHNSSKIMLSSRQVRRRDVLSISQKCCNRPVPTLLRNGVVWPLNIRR